MRSRPRDALLLVEDDLLAGDVNLRLLHRELRPVFQHALAGLRLERLLHCLRRVEVQLRDAVPLRLLRLERLTERVLLQAWELPDDLGVLGLPVLQTLLVRHPLGGLRQIYDFHRDQSTYRQSAY